MLDSLVMPERAAILDGRNSAAYVVSGMGNLGERLT